MKPDTMQSPRVSFDVAVDERKVPPPSSSKLRPFIDLWNDYVENTSVHGVKKSGDVKRVIPLRILWKGALIGFSVALIINLHNLLTEYSQNQFQTAVTIRPSTELDFPAVTICSLNFLNISKVTDDTLHITNATEMLQALYELSSLLDSNSEGSLENITNEIPEIQNITYDSLRKLAAPEVHDMMAACFWNGREEPCGEVMTPVDLENQRCFQFNADASRRRKSKTSGKTSGLEVIVNVGQGNYLFSDVNGAGVQVVLHEPATFPDVINKGFLAPPGFTTMSSVLLREYKYLPAPYKAFVGEVCAESMKDEKVPSVLRHLGLTYTHSSCRLICRLRKSQEECGCRLFDHPFYVQRDRDLPLCTLSKAFGCMRESRARLAKDLNNTLCPCGRLCQGKEFEVSTSMAYFPSESFIRLLKKYQVISSSEDIRSNIVNLKVFFEDLVLEEISHVPRHSLESVLSSVGGQMGLFMGASFLSLLELLELFFRMFLRGARLLYSHIRSKRNAADSESELQ